MSIDQNQKVVEIPTPQDAEIARLGVELNKTYLPYGKMGQAGLTRQSAQDANAARVVAERPGQPVDLQGERRSTATTPGTSSTRSRTASASSTTSRTKTFPTDLRKLDKAARKAKVDEAARQRGTIQAQILKLNKEREQFLAGERKKQLGAKEDTLDQAIIKAIRDQATRHNFTFE